MSWNGTVRCSWCGQSGHNAAGCEEKHEQMKEWRDNPRTSAEFSRATRYFAKKTQKAARAKNRSCSYCEEPGHTKRTCKIRSGDLSIYAKMIYESRIRLNKSFEEKGFGTGALLSFENKIWDKNIGDYVKEKYIGVVTKILYDEMSHRTGDTRWHTNYDRHVLVSWVNHPSAGLQPWRTPLPLRALDINNVYKDEYKTESIDWILAENAKVRILVPSDKTETPRPSMLACEKLAAKFLDEAGKQRLCMPFELQEELSSKNIKF